MTCRYCGTELPTSAMFCGECGRSVVQSVVQSVAPAVAPVAAPAVVRAVIPVTPPAVVPVTPPAVKLATEPLLEPLPAPLRESLAAPLPELLSGPVSEPLAESLTDSLPNFLSERARADEEHADTESTRIVPRDQVGDRFVLQFSTGESQVVWGSGLVGRNPTPEPGEQFTHRISIVDPGKSVSKTHLEFGQSAGAFWICDRFSGNGTEIRQPNSSGQRCDPGKRYLLARGSRIDMGDQFFVVS